VWRSLPRGFRVGRKYRVVEEVGRGGMASVYRAEKLAAFEKEREVALKVPAPDLMRDQSTRQRFEQEIEVSRRLSAAAHPHIVKVLDYEVFDDPFSGQELYALVLEFVPGVNLARWLAQRKESATPVTLGEVRTVLKGVCDALEHAHRQGVFHRDLKPHNVMVAKGPVVKLMDFGIARVLEEGREQLTQAGQVLGTPVYLPPELLGPQPVVDARTDVYLAGNLLLELLTGDPQGDAESRNDCPPAWVELIADSMNRVRSKRPPSIAAFRERLLAEPAPAPPREIVNSLGMKLVPIPPGKFLMGSPANEPDRGTDEQQHAVELTRAFWLGIHPVTVGQFRAFAEATGYRTQAEREGGAYRWTNSKWELDARTNWQPNAKERHKGDRHPNADPRDAPLLSSLIFPFDCGRPVVHFLLDRGTTSQPKAGVVTRHPVASSCRSSQPRMRRNPDDHSSCDYELRK
jgi:serine/threonine protein kinase